MQSDKVDAAALAELITKHCIDTVVLNACESAKGAASASNLAHVLTDAGVKTTIGMSFEVLSLSAELFMKAFYEVLLTHDGHALDAVSRARAALLGMPKRETRYGVQIDLYDHIIPIVHSSQASLSEFLQEQPPHPTLPELSMPLRSLQEAPLYGRESTILELENLLAQNPPFKVFVRGGPGVGKTALMRHASQWWKETELYQTVIFLPLHEPEYRNLNYPTFIQKIHENFPSIPLEDKAILKALNNKNNLLVLDSLDSVSWDSSTDRMQEIKRINRFIQRLRKCAVVLVSRCQSTDFDWDYSVVIGPLNLEAATSFGLKYLEKQDPDGGMAARAREQLADFKQMIGMMAGNPLAIRMMLYDLRMNLQSSDNVTIRSHVEGLLNHRTILLDDAPYPYEEVRAATELGAALLKLSPAFQPAVQQDVLHNNNIDASQSNINNSDVEESSPTSLPSDRALYFNLCLSLSAFWNNMFQGELYAMMFLAINQAHHLVELLELEYVVAILSGSHDEGQTLVDCMQDWCSTNGRDNNLRNVVEKCIQKAKNATSWMQSLLENELLHFVTSRDQDETYFTSGKLNTSFYTVSPIFTLVARSSFIRSFGLAELGFCTELSMLKLYTHHLDPIYQKILLPSEKDLFIDSRRLADLDFWNYLSIAMTYHRAPHYPKAPLCFGLRMFSFCSHVSLDKLPFLELMTRNCTTALIEEVNRIKATLSPQIEFGLDRDTKDPLHQYLLSIGQSLELYLGSTYELGISCCSKMGISDDFYLQAKDVYDNDPLFMTNPSFNDKMRRSFKAKQLESTALIMSRNNDAPESIIREIERLREERYSAVLDQYGIDYKFEKIDTSNKFQYVKAYDQTGQGGLLESIETRLYEITNAHMGPFVYETTEVIQERLPKLHELLREDLPLTIRRNIHKALAFNHRRIGEYLLANEHEKLQREVESKFDPENLAKIKAHEQSNDKYWMRESAKSHTAQGHIKEVETLIEQEKAALQTGLQGLSLDDPRMLAKTYRIGLLLNGASRYIESVPWLLRTIQGRRQNIGMDVEGVLEPVLELAKAFKWCFKLDEAIVQLRPVVLQALQQGKHRVVTNEYFMEAQILLGEIVSMKATWQTPAADLLVRKGLYQEARGYWASALKFYRDTYGLNCAGAITCLIDLAVVAEDLAEHQVAEQHVQEALRIRRADIQDPYDHYILWGETVMGTVLFGSGKYDEGEKMMSEVLERRLSRYGSSSVHTLNTMHHLGCFYEQRDKLDEARELATEHFEILVKNQRLRIWNGGFSFGYKSLGMSGFEAQVSRMLQSFNPTTEQTSQDQG